MDRLEAILKKVQDKFGIEQFNEMQREAINDIPKANDTLLLSATGSGKTFAFLIPIMAEMDNEIETTQSLILAPTRELAMQITGVAKKMALGFNIEVCYGGHPIRFEKKSLATMPQIVIGTPGRIQDHLERGNLLPGKIEFLVIDEFDKCLEMGFHKQMEAIIKFFIRRPKVILTSATDSISIPGFMGFRELEKIDFLSSGKLEGLEIQLVRSQEKDKLETLFYLLQDVGHETTFVFCNYRETVERVSEFLTEKNIHNAFLHGGLNQIERENVLSKFRNGTTTLLVTTDLAGRGLDIPEVDNVIHYHHPITAEVYIHRNGRTARMDAEGKAFIMVHPEEDLPEYVGEIPREFYLSREVKKLPKPDWKTLTINKGKRDKVNKVDVVGFLSKIGQLSKDDLGLVELKESYSLAAVKKDKIRQVIKKTDNQKIKGKKARVNILP